MKILEQVSIRSVSPFGAKATVFEVPSSMRTITIDEGLGTRAFNRYHLSLPKMRFMSLTTTKTYRNNSCVYWLNGLYGVFLGNDGEVYPMILNDVGTNGEICLGDTERSFESNDLEALTDEIYSSFIQSRFSHSGSTMIRFYEFNCVQGCYHNKKHKSFEFFMNKFYTDWSSRGRNYNICSDIEVEFRSMLHSKVYYKVYESYKLSKYFVIGGI